ncbi:hypothetical protein GDO81_026673 [Engystomops pustulosus]|uniref:Uncharacterized protein n=1 Tax=Engystomops pustulosus TaxID=76066 RepID=A0AAV6Z959_ENGPU|nr:hypothetical protein GDO81_026673 [Engystomops pustulosus]
MSISGVGLFSIQYKFMNLKSDPSEKRHIISQRVLLLTTKLFLHFTVTLKKKTPGSVRCRGVTVWSPLCILCCKTFCCVEYLFSVLHVISINHLLLCCPLSDYTTKLLALIIIVLMLPPLFYILPKQPN